MAGGDPALPAGFDGRVAQHLERARVGVVAFVDVHIDVAIISFRYGKDGIDMLPAMGWAGLVERHAADHVGAAFHRLAQQRFGAGVADNAELRKGDDLQLDYLGEAVPHLDQRLQRDQPAHAVDVDMGAHAGDAVGDRRGDDATGALGDLAGLVARLAGAQNGDRLVERARPVHRHALGEQNLVEVDVRLDEAGDAQPAGGVDFLGWRPIDGVGLDKPAVGDRQIHRAVGAPDQGVADEQIGSERLCHAAPPVRRYTAALGRAPTASNQRCTLAALSGGSSLSQPAKVTVRKAVMSAIEKASPATKSRPSRIVSSASK